MSFSYTPESPRDIDYVRLNIRDTDNNNAKFQDEEIEMILNEEGGNVLYASYNLCLTLSAKFAYLASTKIGDYEVKYTDLSKYYQSLADKFRIKAATRSAVPYAGALTHADKEVDEENLDMVQPRFYTQMQEYNKTPNQNKGSW